jgi:sulfite exporter TauE/SafE/copper chaperone CopZ
MTCASCERRIYRALSKTAGVSRAKVSYDRGFADIEYDPAGLSLSALRRVIEDAGYSVLPGDAAPPRDWSRIAGLVVIIFALYVMLSHLGILNLLTPGRLAEAGMSYSMLFVVGLLTSAHCMAMCGGINLSQTVGGRGLAPTALYNLGRVISYTITGFIVGALGSVISFNLTVQGALKLVAGIFMVIMGVNILGVFPALRKLTIRLPRFHTGSKSPLIVGLLNGLMPCGPLQAMQIFALSAGSPIKGALSMLMFSLGTVPLMFGLGALSSALGKRFSGKVMTAGAVLVVVLGLSMLSQGWSLSGFGLPFAAGGAGTERGENAFRIEDGYQAVSSTLQSGRYPAITVRDGIPVKWTIDAPKGSINGCNNSMIIPEYGIKYSFKTGENVIEFTPAGTGSFRYSCWMGMIRGAITVVDG